MSWFSELLHPGRAYKDAQKEMEKYYNQGQGYQQPYNQQGQEQYQTLMDYINSLQNPEELYNKWAQGYQESPAAKLAQGMATEQGLGAASSLGLMGSSPALQAIQAGSTGIAMQDREKYLNDLMQKYMAGAGLSQGIYGTGANAAGQMGQNAMNMGQNAANLKYGEKSAGGNMLASGLGALGGIAGGALSGSMGNALANKLGWNTTGYSPNGPAMRTRYGT